MVNWLRCALTDNNSLKTAESKNTGRICVCLTLEFYYCDKSLGVDVGSTSSSSIHIEDRGRDRFLIKSLTRSK